MYLGEITRNQSWALELQHVPDEMRLAEAELQLTRWFDYRQMLPGQLTDYFVERYKEIYRQWYAKVRDEGESEFIPVVHFKTLFGSTELLQFWNARQAADRIGCDYDFYLRFAMHRCVERAWRYLPRANQLYGEELQHDLELSWQESLRAQLKLATDPRYKAANYIGHPDQDAYHEYLVGLVNMREQKHMVIARLIFKENIFTQETAVRLFGTDLVKQAVSFYNS